MSEIGAAAPQTSLEKGLLEISFFLTQRKCLHYSVNLVQCLLALFSPLCGIYPPLFLKQGSMAFSGSEGGMREKGEFYRQ